MDGNQGPSPSWNDIYRYSGGTDNGQGQPAQPGDQRVARNNGQDLYNYNGDQDPYQDVRMARNPREAGVPTEINLPPQQFETADGRHFTIYNQISARNVYLNQGGGVEGGGPNFSRYDPQYQQLQQAQRMGYNPAFNPGYDPRAAEIAQIQAQQAAIQAYRQEALAAQYANYGGGYRPNPYQPVAANYYAPGYAGQNPNNPLNWITDLAAIGLGAYAISQGNRGWGGGYRHYPVYANYGGGGFHHRRC